MVSAINNALGGMQASERRVQASASNIANARTTVSTEDARAQADGGRREAPSRDEAVIYEPVRVHQESVEGGGVRAEFVPYEPPYVEVYAPDDRLADDDGMVARPNVDYATELVEMRQAEQAYRANAKTIVTENQMIGALLNERH